MELSAKMYLITENEYILERTFRNRTEYFYCVIHPNSTRDNLTRGRINSGELIFSKEDFFYQTTFEDMEKLETRILG